MSTGQRMSEQEYEAFVLSGAEGAWELHDGYLVEKPALSGPRGTVVTGLARQLLPQLDPAAYETRINDGRVRAGVDTILIPDVLIVPTADSASFGGGPGLVIHARPVPLVVEVWAPPTEGHDVDARIPRYQQRGDLEIWRIHPTERTLTTWVRQPDGTYQETIYQSGMALPTALRGALLRREQRFDA
jgi:hypothetical protein